MAPLSLKMRRAIINAAIRDAEAGKPNLFAAKMAMKRASRLHPSPTAPPPKPKRK